MVDAEAARVLPVEVAALAEDLLRARVVPLLVEVEVDRAEVVVPVVVPAGQRPGLLAHVVLGVRAAIGAEREELHHLARVVLVRIVLRVVGAVEPEQHRGVARDVAEERRERSEPVRPEEPVLLEHQPRRPDALARGGEPVVPDERHPLGQRAPRPDHPVEPPELVVAPGVVRGERAPVVVVGLRALEPLAAGVRQVVDGAVEAHPREPLRLTRTRAETGTPKQPFGLRLAKVSSVHGGGHAFALSAGSFRGLNPVRVRTLNPCLMRRNEG